MFKNFKYTKTSEGRKGITLIALVVTIIILLLLAAVTISLVLGPGGIVAKARQTKVAGRYGNIIDRKSQRDANLEIAKRLGENEEDINIFVNKLKTEGLIIEGEDYYDEDEGIIYLGKQSDNSYLYEVELSGTQMLNGANSPDISGFNQNTTYYVTWNTTSSPYVINESIKISQVPPTGWSNYNEGVNQWANIKTTGGGNDCYWVWIPRYAYKVPTANRNVAEEIDIKFLVGTTNTPKGETEITNTTPTPGSWVVHPAFTNIGNNGFGELRGIWVAKYEASCSTVGEVTFVGATMSGDIASLSSNGGGVYTNQQIRVKPNVTSWRGINVNDIFDATRNMTSGINTNSSLTGTSGIDSHMMKNTEWGAVAYLSMSKYGKNSRVWNNSFYDNNTTHNSSITGLAGSLPTTIVTSTETMHTYNTTGGINASTTGNVYGVYDMAGGAWDCTAGYLSEIEPNVNYIKLVNAEDKYKDKYAGIEDSNINYNLNANKYGDAIYETSLSGNSTTASWDATFSLFPSNTAYFFIRGGNAINGNNTGIFAFYIKSGPSIAHGFRPTLVAGQ